MDALRRARSYSSNAHGDMPRSLRAPERLHSGNHRHAGCESDRKRGVSIDPVGYDAGKKIKGIKRNALVDTERPPPLARNNSGKYPGSRLCRWSDQEVAPEISAPEKDLC